MSEGMTGTDTEVAALREENARLKRERLTNRGIEDLKWDNDQLRAHVAALVKALREAAEWGSLARGFYVEGSDGDMLSNRVFDLLDAPDLARLVAIEQARDAVIEAATEVLHTNHSEVRLALSAALRALDAARDRT